MTKHFINEQYDVEDADMSSSYGKGEKREDYADAWENTGNIILVGLEGSGKAALAEALSERTGLNVVMPGDASNTLNILKGEKQIVVLKDSLVEDQAVHPLLHSAGKVFYLMVDSNTLASRLAERENIEDSEPLWRDLSARLAVMEPMFYGVLHFILQPQTAEEMLEDALEKVAF